MNHWFTIYGINQTKLRVAHFLAQVICETAGFVYLEELTDGKKYEPTTRAGRNVGNKLIGDGPKFIGRGLLHLTGRENYKKYGDILHEDLISNPGSVSTNYSLAVRTACEYWNVRRVNSAADNDDINKVTILINGGYNGLNTRKESLLNAKRELGI